MVQKIKSALENLDTPRCRNCKVEMRWVRSALVSFEPAAIMHSFFCPNCALSLSTTSAPANDALEVSPGEIGA